MPEPQVEYSAAGPVHDERKQDDGQDYHDHPEEEPDDAGNGMPRYSSRSSHGRQLPAAVRFIRLVHLLLGTQRGRLAASGTLQARGQTRMLGAIAGEQGFGLLLVPGMASSRSACTSRNAACLATGFSGMAALCMPRDKSLRKIQKLTRDQATHAIRHDRADRGKQPQVPAPGPGLGLLDNRALLPAAMGGCGVKSV